MTTFSIFVLAAENDDCFNEVDVVRVANYQGCSIRFCPWLVGCGVEKLVIYNDRC